MYLLHLRERYSFQVMLIKNQLMFLLLSIQQLLHLQQEVHAENTALSRDALKGMELWRGRRLDLAS